MTGAHKQQCASVGYHVFGHLTADGVIRGTFAAGILVAAIGFILRKYYPNFASSWRCVVVGILILLCTFAVLTALNRPISGSTAFAALLVGDSLALGFIIAPTTLFAVAVRMFGGGDKD